MHYFYERAEKNDLLGLCTARSNKRKETFVGNVLILQIHRIWHVRVEGILGCWNLLPLPLKVTCKEIMAWSLSHLSACFSPPWCSFLPLLFSCKLLSIKINVF